MEALDTYDAARLPVAAPASGVVAGDPKQRQRFYVQLAPGETTLVSWKELVREANNEVVSVDTSNKALVQEADNKVESPDSSDKYPVIPFALVKRAKNGPDSATTRLVERNPLNHQISRGENEERNDGLCYQCCKHQEQKSAQHDLQSRSSMSMKISPTLSAETIKEEISYLILIFLIQTMHRFWWNLPQNPHPLPIHQIPPPCQPVGPIPSTKLKWFRPEPVVRKIVASASDHQQQHQKQGRQQGVEQRHMYLKPPLIDN